MEATLEKETKPVKRPARTRSLSNTTLENPQPLALRPGAPYQIPAHVPNPRLFQRQLKIALVGCGGTGSQMLTNLGRIYLSMQQMAAENNNYCRRMAVDVWDPDFVSESNVGRQLFTRGDVGSAKAICLVNRINTTYGTGWRAIPDSFRPNAYKNLESYDIVISCTDTARSRREIHNALFDKVYQYQSTAYWLDCGNALNMGQVIMGEPRRDPKEPGYSVKSYPKSEQLFWAHSRKEAAYNESKVTTPLLRMPCVTELYPHLMDPDIPEDDTPSCSMVEALSRQSLFINQRVANVAADLLWDLLHNGGLNYNGVVFQNDDKSQMAKPLRLWPLETNQRDKTGRPVYPQEWLL